MKRRLRKKEVIRVNEIISDIESNLALNFLKNKINSKTLAKSLQRVKRAGRVLNKIAKSTVEKGSFLY